MAFLFTSLTGEEGKTNGFPSEQASNGARRGELTFILAPGEWLGRLRNDADPECAQQLFQEAQVSLRSSSRAFIFLPSQSICPAEWEAL